MLSVSPCKSAMASCNSPPSLTRVLLELRLNPNAGVSNVAGGQAAQELLSSMPCAPELSASASLVEKPFGDVAAALEEVKPTALTSPNLGCKAPLVQIDTHVSCHSLPVPLPAGNGRLNAVSFPNPCAHGPCNLNPLPGAGLVPGEDVPCLVHLDCKATEVGKAGAASSGKRVRTVGAASARPQ